MRTNIEIDDTLMKRAIRSTGLKTKRVVVEEGLRTLICLADQQTVRELRGKVRLINDRHKSRQVRSA